MIGRLFNKDARPKSDADGQLTQISEVLGKIERQQKEISLQLEEIDSLLQEGDDLENTLITIFDAIYDSYYVAPTDRAAAMLDYSSKALKKAGFEIIAPKHVPFDFHLHSIETTEENADLPAGHVIATLRCGYIRDGKILRRAAVIANKKEGLQ